MGSFTLLLVMDNSQNLQRFVSAWTSTDKSGLSKLQEAPFTISLTLHFIVSFYQEALKVCLFLHSLPHWPQLVFTLWQIDFGFNCGALVQGSSVSDSWVSVFIQLQDHYSALRLQYMPMERVTTKQWWKPGSAYLKQLLGTAWEKLTSCLQWTKKALYSKLLSAFIWVAKCHIQKSHIVIFKYFLNITHCYFSLNALITSHKLVVFLATVFSLSYACLRTFNKLSSCFLKVVWHFYFFFNQLRVT